MTFLILQCTSNNDCYLFISSYLLDSRLGVRPKWYHITQTVDERSAKNITQKITLQSALRNVTPSPRISYSSDYFHNRHHPQGSPPKNKLVPVRMVLSFIGSLGPNNSTIDDHKGSNQVRARIREFGPCLAVVWNFFARACNSFSFIHSPTDRFIGTW